MHHAVQFYETDTFLIGRLVSLVDRALSARAPIAIVATRPHLEALRARLAHRVDHVRLIDAELALAGLREGDDFSRSRLEEIVADARGTNGAPLFFYSELVDLLSRRGETAGALRVEALLSAAFPADGHLTCGYSVEPFVGEGGRAVAETVLEFHPQGCDAEHAQPPAVSLPAQARAIAERADLWAAGQLRAQRDRAQQEATEQLASMGLLTASVAHDVNDPLSYVLGNLGWLVEELDQATRQPPTPEQARELAQAARDALEGAQRIHSVVRTIKGLSRLDEAPLSSVEVRPAIERALAAADHLLRERAELVVELSSVPNAWASTGKLFQLCLNLLLNASESFAQKLPLQTIKVRTHQAGEKICLEISHNGVPCTDDGLGLAAVNAIVQELGGTFELATSSTAGTRFTVLLGTQPTRQPSPAPTRTRRRILVVDDDHRVLDSLSRLLEPLHDVRAAASAVEALALIEREGPFDLVLADVIMPDMPGVDLAQRLRRERELPVVFMTGATSSQRRQLQLDEQSCLLKPFNLADLEVMIDRCAKN